MSATAAPAATLRALVESAVLAPSSHNTQPWAFRIDGERLELHADRTRALAVNDPHDRELTISCGAAWLNARVAAADAGAGLETVLLPEGEEADLLAAGTLTGGAPEAGLPPAAAIARRRTHREPFADRPVAPEALAGLAEAAAAEGARLEVVAADRRAELAALVAEGDRLQFADPRWRRELASWMHPRRRGEGLVVPALAAPATRFVVTHLDVGGRTAGKDAALAEQAPVVAVLTTEQDGPRDWLRAGQALERLLLTACTHDLQASYLNQPVQVEALRPRLAALLADGGVPQLVLRLGHPVDELDAAPRRPVEAVLE
jgi:hypothetical protein